MTPTFSPRALPIVLAFALVLLAPILALAQGGASPDSCPTLEIDTVSLYLTEPITQDADLGAALDGKVAMIEKLARKLELKSFQIASQNLSVAPAGFRGSVLEVTYSFTLEFEANSAAVGPLFKDTAAFSYSLTRARYPRCEKPNAASTAGLSGLSAGAASVSGSDLD